MIMKDVHQKCDKIYLFINSYERSYQFITNKIDSLNIIKYILGYEFSLNLIENINDQEYENNIILMLH